MAGLCKAAVEQGIVLVAKHSDAPDGVSCFYLECDDMESDQTRAGEYGEMFQSETKLEQFLDLYTGAWK